MVNIKVLLLSSIILSAFVLAEEVAPPAAVCAPDNNSVSSSSSGTLNEDALTAALAQVSAILATNSLLERKNNPFPGLSLDNLASFVGTAVAPIGFDRLCDSLSSVSENLGHLLDGYAIQGVRCSNEIRNTINNAMECRNIDEGANLAAQLLQPLAIDALQSISEKINAQTLCLQSLLNDGK
jgi:hypothetical protein